MIGNIKYFISHLTIKNHCKLYSTYIRIIASIISSGVSNPNLHYNDSQWHSNLH